MKHNYILNMNLVNKLFALVIISMFVNFSANAQIKKSSQLSADEYQKQKELGNLPKMFPKEFPTSKIVVAKNNKPAKEVSKIGLVHTSNKSSRYKSLTNSNCNYVFGYEAPILSPDTDLNGDIVMDTVVQFFGTNIGPAPLYRNDDGSSAAMKLPFTFCFI